MMKRIDAIKRITEELNGELVICNIGYPSRELYAAKDSSKHFYMLGSMGMASSIGLGLALAQKRKVVVLDGDGSLLMNLGSLATIYAQSPPNLVLVVIDNECYGSTGSQCSYASTVDLKKWQRVWESKIFFFSETIDFKKVLETEGPVFVHLKVEPGNADVPIIPIDAIEIKERFEKEVKNK